MTLIELLIVVAISAIIMIALLELYMAGQRYFFNEDAKADAIEDSRMPMTWISRDVREAREVVGSAGTYSTGANSIILGIPLPSAPAVNSSLIIYRRDPSYPERLERILAAVDGTPTDVRIMADAVNAFGLIYYQQDGITQASTVADTFIVDVTLSSTKKGIQRANQPFVEALNTRIRLRNKAVS